MPGAAVDLYWIPLGAGGRSVRFNGKVYEAIAAAIARRPRRDIYHAALTIQLPEGRYAVEMTPVVNQPSADRGVVTGGPVGARWAGRFRVFRYEVRRWLDGTIPDLEFAVGTVRLSDDEIVARHILDVVPSVPSLVWGRDEVGAGEMWSCNSIISWTLTRADIDATAIRLPSQGRAPGWEAGIIVASEGCAPAPVRLPVRERVPPPQHPRRRRTTVKLSGGTGRPPSHGPPTAADQTVMAGPTAR